MHILQVNHGYPMRYNAGSEVYTRTLAMALAARGHRVSVFARQEDPHLPEYTITEERDGDIPVFLANMARSQHRFQHDELDRAFAALLARLQPEVVHFHHLNHLSVGLVRVAERTGATVVFTAHDFWIVCPRGQLLRWDLSPEPWGLCDHQDDHRCARLCYARAHTGLMSLEEHDLRYWQNWCHARMTWVERAVDAMHAIVSPSRTVAEALTTRFPQVEGKLHLRDYGFPPLDVQRRGRAEGEPFTFGYIGTHIAQKGLDQLIRSFLTLDGKPRLRIWGRHRAQATEALEQMAKAAGGRISFEGEYENGEVGPKVLSQVDTIVVPSIWLENSPLVIHEAQQGRLCVVTADAGGMAELVQHEANGLLFRHRDENDLARQLQRLVDEPGLAERLGERGYLRHPLGLVPSSEDDAAFMEQLYERLRSKRHLRPRHTTTPDAEVRP